MNTLALAEYRVGHWNESIAAAEHSMALREGGSASDWFFLAMAHWQKGEKGEARKWFKRPYRGPKKSNRATKNFCNSGASRRGCLAFPVLNPQNRRNRKRRPSDERRAKWSHFKIKCGVTMLRGPGRFQCASSKKEAVNRQTQRGPATSAGLRGQPQEAGHKRASQTAQQILKWRSTP